MEISPKPPSSSFPSDLTFQADFVNALCKRPGDVMWRHDYIDIPRISQDIYWLNEGQNMTDIQYTVSGANPIMVKLDSISWGLNVEQEMSTKISIEPQSSLQSIDLSESSLLVALLALYIATLGTLTQLWIGSWRMTKREERNEKNSSGKDVRRGDRSQEAPSEQENEHIPYIR
jgi:hypothetical protein